MRKFFEMMYFSPKWYHYIMMVLLLPLSFLYASIMLLRRLFTSKKSFNIPIVSVGNLIVGGAGKTPFVMALASRYDGVTVISRGYGRKSQGLLQVSAKGKILTSVHTSGDEAMLIAKSLPNASVIVSENREIAIELAMREGAKLIILDDGFNRVEIKKFEIVLEPQRILNYFPFPSGPFREFPLMKCYADIVVKEGSDFHRMVEFENLSEKMLLVTAISHPQRLDSYLPEGVVGKVYLEDHAYFNEEHLLQKMQEYGALSLLVTQKDAVKMETFKLPLSFMKLKLEIDDTIMSSVDDYVSAFYK